MTLYEEYEFSATDSVYKCIQGLALLILHSAVMHLGVSLLFCSVLLT